MVRPDGSREKEFAVSKSGDRSSVLSSLGSLFWPVVLGSWATGLLYLLMYKGPLNYPIFFRYFAGHPVCYFETGLAIIGFFALMFKAAEVWTQYRALGTIRLEPIPPRGQRLTDSTRLIDEMEQQYSAKLRQTYLGRRLRDALEHVERSNSAAALDAELKYLSDMDAARQQETYGLARIVIWATPMLGFLGTVMGITQALGDMDPAQLATDVQNAMKGLLAGLYVAFDTTALALMLSMVLMFIQFIIERFESQIMGVVDIRANEELIGRFEQLGASHDPHVASMERIGEAVIHAVEAVVNRQADLWKETIGVANAQWAKVVGSSTDQVQAALASSLQQSLAHHAAEMAKIERASGETVSQRWQQWQAALSESARLLHAQQQEMTRQGELLHKAIAATGDVVKLEQALNANLSALAGSKNFEDTVMSLSAAIHLLTARLPHDAKHVELTVQKPSVQGRAA
jgi:biopolymer transport protein ExbB/TolQ